MKLEYKTSKQLFKYNEAGIQNKQTVIQVQWSWNTKQANSYSSTMMLEYKTSKQLLKYNEAGIQNKQTVVHVQN